MPHSNDPLSGELMASLKSLSNKEMKDLSEVAANADDLIMLLNSYKQKKSQKAINIAIGPHGPQPV